MLPGLPAAFSSSGPQRSKLYGVVGRLLSLYRGFVPSIGESSRMQSPVLTARID